MAPQSGKISDTVSQASLGPVPAQTYPPSKGLIVSTTQSQTALSHSFSSQSAGVKRN